MGITLSRFCTSWRDWLQLLLEDNQVESEAIAISPISSGDGRKTLRSISFGTRNESVVEMIQKPDERSSSGEVTKQLQVSISFKKNGAETEIETTSTTISVTGLSDEAGSENVEKQPVPASSSKIKLRLCFGSGRRAVLMGSQWWKLLESTELERSSMTYTSGTSETAKSKWYRAQAKAKRVGKGLSKNAVFRKLASQHWLEAVDPGHRYGHNLRYYYVLWRNSPSREPFFHWLNHGEGKDLNLDEICPRSKLHQQRVKYLSPAEREAYEVLLEDGKFKYKKSNQLIDTRGDSKWIFVLSTSGILYVGEKEKGLFHHSSFLAGGAVSAAGRVLVENGVLKAITRQSGHYRPTEENFEYFVSFLKENNVDLKDVDMTSFDDAETHPKRGIRRKWSQEDLTHLVGVDQEVKMLNQPISKTVRIRSLPRKLSVILVPKKHHPFRSLSAPVCRCSVSAHM